MGGEEYGGMGKGGGCGGGGLRLGKGGRERYWMHDG